MDVRIERLEWGNSWTKANSFLRVFFFFFFSQISSSALYISYSGYEAQKLQIPKNLATSFKTYATSPLSYSNHFLRTNVYAILHFLPIFMHNTLNIIQSWAIHH